MRRFYHIVLFLAAILGLCSCNPESKVRYDINIDSNVNCTYMEQYVDIDYLVHEDVMTSDIEFSVSCDDEWVTVVDCSVIGKIRLHVDENHGGSRSSHITISAPRCVTKSITLMQYGVPPQRANHTLIFYFFGTSLGRYFDINIEDAIMAINDGALGSNNRVIFMRQDSKHEAYIGELCYDIDGGECLKHRLVEGIQLDSQQVTPEHIGGYIKQMADLAPADRYGIVFAGHGQGWIPRHVLNGSGGISALSLMNVWQPAIGAEVTRAFGENNIQVDPAELAEGIELSGVELDYILFDACFMANIETLYDLRNSANYIIASPCEIMGKGFPYHRTLRYLFSDEGMTTDYVGAAESYYRFYKNEYNGSSRCGSIAVFDCAEIEALTEATKSVVESATDDYIPAKLQTYEGQLVHQFFDYGQWVRTVATDRDALAEFNVQIDKAVIAKYSLPTFYSAYGTYGTYPIDLDVYSGVTTSAPSAAYPDYWKQTSWYKAVWE